MSGKIGVTIISHSSDVNYLYTDNFFPVNVAHRLDPSLPAGYPEVVPKLYTDYMTRYNTSKAARILKIASRSEETSKVKGSADAEDDVRYYKSMEEATKDILAYFKAKGW
jgi:hypothetical protein